MSDRPGRNDESQETTNSLATGTGSATRHVGPTLESEGIFQDVEGSALSTGEGGQDSNPVDSLDVRTLSEDRAYQQSDQQEDDQLAQGTEAGGSAEVSDISSEDSFVGIAKKLGQTPEPLKTRLAGDTSSDPHTDLGPDNATTVQARTETDQAPDYRNNR